MVKILKNINNKTFPEQAALAEEYKLEKGGKFRVVKSAATPGGFVAIMTIVKGTNGECTKELIKI